jgi:hypothetical protein
VLKQRHEAQLAWPMMRVFAAVVDVVGKGRWSDGVLQTGVAPRVGSDYERQRGKVLRRGKVLACLKPVSMTLHETLLDPPCCVQLRLHWRLEPLETGSALLLDARFSLNGAATLRRRHWCSRIHAHCARMLTAVQTRLAAAAAEEPDGASAEHGERSRGGSVSQ